MELNENQKLAVTCDLTPTIVIAGPGSGKTQVIVNRINYMIEILKCQPYHILVVTFSKLAAEEMKSRFQNIYGEVPITFGTLHSIFYRILRKANPTRYAIERLLLEDKRKSLLTQLLKEMDTDEGEEFLENFIKHVSLMKNQLMMPNEYEPDGIPKNAFLSLLARYEAYKERQGLFDFDDMLVECYYLLKNDYHVLRAASHQFQYILVDEFQDINLVQFEIIKMLVHEHKHIFVVGDDDQSIYQFRGAKPAYLLDFKKHFPNAQSIYLNVNYRCSNSILQHSLALIEKNKIRYPKKLTTPNPNGQVPHFITCKDAKAEALHIVHEVTKRRQLGVTLKDMAIIYRTNIQARPIVEAFLAANIPFCLRDGMISLYEQWITKDILSYLHLSKDLNRVDCACKIINKPKRYISKVNIELAKKGGMNLFLQLLSLDTLTQWQKDYIQEFLFDLQVLKEKTLIDAIRYIRHNIGYDNYLTEYAAYRKMPVLSLFEVLEDIEDSAVNYTNLEEWENALKQVSNEIKNTKHKIHSDVITLTTMHGAKGLEFDTVFIIDVINGIIPYHKSQSNHEIEEERRLFYVGMTRAKQELFLYLPQEKHGKPVQASPFINDIKTSLFEKQITVGQWIYHKNMGRGEILEIMDNGIILVKFKHGQKRKIDSIYCLSNAIITWEDEENEKK